MAAKGGRIDFMFLSPPYPAAASATATKSSTGVTGVVDLNNAACWRQSIQARGSTPQKEVISFKKNTNALTSE